MQVLRASGVNRELSDLDQLASKRETIFFFRIQEGVTRSLTAVADFMSATRQAADDRPFLDTKKHFSALPDTARRPMAVHKDLLQVQRESLRLEINPKYRVLCNAKHYKDIESNEFLFGNTSKKAEEMLKASKITERYTGGNKKERKEENAPRRSRNQHHQSSPPVSYNS